jgi:release factor glutamine methyltransferase
MAEPRREAARLFAGLAGTSPGDLLLRAAMPAEDPELVARFEAGVERRALGEPIQYVTGMTGFRRLTVRCDRRALIPRPESEGLIDLALSHAPAGRALDLGTGTGCLALALADEGRYDEVTAVDRSPDALELARQNGARLGPEVRWLLGDWCGPVAGEQFDLIVSNPPYISASELEGLDASVREFEPWLALDGGRDGLDAVRRLVEETPAVLAPGGWLVMELDSARASASAELALRAGWTTVRVSDDLFGRPRFLVARRERPHV